MPYQGKKQQQGPEEHKNARPEEQFVPEHRTFGMPNSLMQAVPITPPSGTPNSVMREMEAEESGALFRGRGFDPSVGAHELSHTVRRAAVPAPVSLSVPSGTIQRANDDENDDEKDNGFTRISGGEIDDDQIGQDIALWAQKLHSKEGGGRAARKNAKAAAKRIKEAEDFRAAMEAAMGGIAEEGYGQGSPMSPKDQQKKFNRGSGAKVTNSSKINVGGIGGGLEKDSTVRGKESWRERLARFIEEHFYKEE